MRALNGNNWENSADAIEAHPTKQVTIGLLESLFNGDRLRACEAYWLVRLWNSTDDEETASFVLELIEDINSSK